MAANGRHHHVHNHRSPVNDDRDSYGPSKHRSCTDIICLFLFIIFLAVWAALGFYAYLRGDPLRLLLPTDSYGNRCGRDEFSNKTDLLFFDLTACSISGCHTPQICMESCPTDLWIADIYTSKLIEFNETDIKLNLKCKSPEIVQSVTSLSILADMITQKACAQWYYPSEPLCYRCVPNLKSNYSKVLEDFLAKYNLPASVQSLLPFNPQILNSSSAAIQSVQEFNQISQDVMRDLSYTWRYLVIFSIAGLIISMVYIFLMRFLAGVVIWVSILALIALFATGSYFSYENYAFLRDNPTGRVVSDSTSLQGQVTGVLNSKEFWMGLLIICAVLLVLILLIVLFLRKRICLATALIKEGSKAVGSTLSALFFPLVPWVLQLGVLVWSIAIFLYLYSTGTNIYRVEGLDSNCTCTGLYKNISNNNTCSVEEFNDYCHQIGTTDTHCYTAGCSIYSLENDNIVLYLQLFNLFGFFWGIWFVTGLGEMILAGVFATWYWTFNKRNVPFFTLTKSINRTLIYHLGTVAFGSLIIAICSFIRAVLEYLEKKLKPSQNPVVKWVCCCCKCFFWCLEKFLAFINKNAYIMCAMHGKNFCCSAKDAFQLLLRNVIRVVMVDKVTDFLLFLGKALVTAAVTVASWFVFKGKIRLLDDSGQDVYLVYNWLPVVLVAIMTYIIATVFFSVYSMAVDTLFLCFLEDSEKNDGSKEKPFFMSTELMKILGRKNKKS